MNNGWTHPNPITATKEVIAPLIGGFLGMIILPAAGVWATGHFLDVSAESNFTSKCVLSGDWQMIIKQAMCSVKYVYPGIFLAVGLVRLTMISTRLLSSWSQSIRDKEFLVEMRLRNLEPESDNKTGNLAAHAESTKQNDTNVPPHLV